MDSVEDYARPWERAEKENLDTVSEWAKSVRSLIQNIISKLKGPMNTRKTSIFKNPHVTKHLSYLHDKYVVVPADKALNNIVLVCKLHYIDCLKTELGIDNLLGNPKYTPTTHMEEDILDNLFCVP